MSDTLKALTLTVLVIALAWGSPTRAEDTAAPAQPVATTVVEQAAQTEAEEPKPLPRALGERPYDAVSFRTERLKGALMGAPIAKLRAYTTAGARPGTLRPAAIQVDERSAGGQLIMTHGDVARQVKDADGDWVDAPNLGFLTPKDEMLLLARDAGARFEGDRAATPLARATEVAEIAVQDAGSGSVGYFYLARYGENAPVPFEADYIRYELRSEKKRKFKSEHVWSPRYHVAFSNPDAPFAYSDLQISHQDDGAHWGPDFLDAFRVLISMNPFWVNIVFTSEDIAPSRLGYIDGPIRVVRRLHLGVKVLGIPVPDFVIQAFTDSELDTDSFYYPHYFFFEGVMAVPQFLVDRSDDAYGVFLTDFNRHAEGGVVLSSNNYSGDVRVDGRMTDAERNIAREFPEWMLMASPNGGWMNMLRFGDAFADVRKSIYYVDNALDTPEDDDDDRPEFKQAYGITGYYVDEFHKTDISKPMNFKVYVFPLPPGFSKGDEVQYTRILNAPLEIGVAKPAAEATAAGN